MRFLTLATGVVLLAMSSGVGASSVPFSAQVATKAASSLDLADLAADFGIVPEKRLTAASRTDCMADRRDCQTIKVAPRLKGGR